MINRWALFKKSEICIGVLPEGRAKNVIEIFEGSLEEACDRAAALEREMRKNDIRRTEESAAPTATPERKRRGRPRKNPIMA